MLTTFLETCMKLLRDEKAVKWLQEPITRCAGQGELRVVRKLGKHTTQIGMEMRLTAQIGEYAMDQVILDLGSNVNVLPKQTWEHMGRPALQWSVIQLQMVNQRKILSMGILQGITVDIKGASALENFDVIEIFYENNSYPVLLGIYWATHMNGVINLKKRKMIFQNNSLCVVIALDIATNCVKPNSKSSPLY